MSNTTQPTSAVIRDASPEYVIVHIVICCIFCILSIISLFEFVKSNLAADPKKRASLLRSKFFWLLVVGHVAYPISVASQAFQLLYYPAVFAVYWVIYVTQGIFVLCYVNLVFLRTKAILQQSSYYKWVKALVYLCTLMFIVHMFNPAVYFTCNGLPLNQCGGALTYFQVWVYSENLLLLIIEVTFTYQLFKYSRQAKSINSPNAQTFSILARHGILCTLFAFLAAVTTVSTGTSVSQTIIGVSSIFYYFFVLLVLLSLVRMKLKINELQKDAIAKTFNINTLNTTNSNNTKLLKSQDAIESQNSSSNCNSESA